MGCDVQNKLTKFKHKRETIRRKFRYKTRKGTELKLYKTETVATSDTL